MKLKESNETISNFGELRLKKTSFNEVYSVLVNTGRKTGVVRERLGNA